MKKIVEVTFRFATWEKDTTVILRDVTKMATELRERDDTLDVVNVAIVNEDEDDE